MSESALRTRKLGSGQRTKPSRVRGRRLRVACASGPIAVQQAGTRPGERWPTHTGRRHEVFLATTTVPGRAPLAAWITDENRPNAPYRLRWSFLLSPHRSRGLCSRRLRGRTPSQRAVSQSYPSLAGCAHLLYVCAGHAEDPEGSPLLVFLTLREVSSSPLNYRCSHG